MLMSRTASLLLLVLLGSCASEEARPPVVSVDAPRQQPDNRPAILALGDSITAGYGVESGAGWPERLQTLIEIEGLPHRIVNAGVSGDTSGGGLERLPSLLRAKPRLVIVELGGNDGLRGLPVASTRANLEEIIQASKAAGAKVLLAGMTLPPNYGADYVAQFEKMYAELAKAHRLTLVPLRLDKVGKEGEDGLMLRDGIHPSAKGHERIAAYMLGFVKKAVT
jgi:acyl-CoA thioesterase-1